LGNSNNLAEITSAYLAGYFSHFTPDFWFFKGDSNLRHSTQFHYPLLWTTIPLFFAGIIGVVKRRKYLFYKFILLSLVIFPAISALTTNAPHIHRTVHMTVVVDFVLVLGAIEIKSWFKSRQLYLTIFLLTIWFGFTLVELSEVGKYYFTDYAQRARSSFHYEDIEVISQLENYPLPHILSTQITEGSLTTYYLVHRTDPKLVQAYPYEVSIFDNLYPDPKPENPLKVSMENLEAPESVFINATYLMPKSLCNLHQEKIEVLYRSEHFCIATKSRLKN
jgi:hypothetical protein